MIYNSNQDDVPPSIISDLDIEYINVNLNNSNVNLARIYVNPIVGIRNASQQQIVLQKGIQKYLKHNKQ